MRYGLEFDLLYHYDTRLTGITLPVSLTAGGRETTATAKLDTGASFCIFDRLVAEDLGLTVEHGEPQSISTVTGAFDVYGHEVLLSAAGFDFQSMIYFAGHYGLPRNVLGRVGFLDRVLIGLDDYAGRLYLSRRNGQ